MKQRVAWDDLAGPVRQATQARTGPITAVRAATAGQNLPLPAIIDAPGGTAEGCGDPHTTDPPAPGPE